MIRYDAVMFDWMLTLADYPGPHDHVVRALEILGREVDAVEVDALVGRLTDAASLPDVADSAAHEDCSPEAHQAATRLLYERAEIDTELGDAMYRLLGHPSHHPVYPEVPSVLAAIADVGARIGIVSDIHVDLRVHDDLVGIGDLVDAWVLSYEHGVQKPDPDIFELALDALDVDPARALMVGDRASHDGAATHLGIDTLILPPHSRAAAGHSFDRLDAVVRLVTS